jgi:hypothetical protein
MAQGVVYPWTISREEKPMMEPASEVNVRSNSYFIARATSRCPGCGAIVPVFALALPPSHEALVPNSAEDDGASVWQAAPWNALLFHVEFLSDPVARRLRALTSAYRLSPGEESGDSHWANHCPACDAIVEDQGLFCEPGGAFLPTSARAASAIRLVRIDEPLEAAASGYGCEPQYFDSMTAA